MQTIIKYFLVLIIIIFLFTKIGKSQNITNLNNNYSRNIYKEFNSLDSNCHTSFKPYILKNNSKFTNPDSVLNNSKINNNTHNWFVRKLRYEDLFYVDTTDFLLRINPIIDFEYSKEDNDSKYVNTRGVSVQGKIGSDLFYYSDFHENQANFNSYINTFVNKYSVVPGQGRPKKFLESSWDYAASTGFLSYSPSKYFNFQFGHGKNFIGDGYRSLLLSDNSFNYPYLKLTTNIWRFQYTNLWTSFMDLNAPHTYESGLRKKYASFHYLSIDLGNRFELSLFEGIIWQDADSTGKRGLDLNYLNPIIFYRPVEYSLMSPDNMILGANMKFKTTQFSHLYMQIVIDDLNLLKMYHGVGSIQNKYGIQTGFKSFDLFKIKNLDFRIEYNQVQPYTYAHKSTLQNYTHYAQALAHPLGANFREGIVFLNYRFKNFFVETQFNYAKYGLDGPGEHWGKDIFKSDYDSEHGVTEGGKSGLGNYLGQGISTDLLFYRITISYLVNPKSNMNLFVSYVNRAEVNNVSTIKTNFFQFGFRTSLTNKYYDF